MDANRQEAMLMPRTSLPHLQFSKRTRHNSAVNTRRTRRTCHLLLHLYHLPHLLMLRD